MPLTGTAQAHDAALRCAMVAGEASGDLLAGLLLDGLRARWPGLVAQGIGGPGMAQRGFEAWWPHDALAVRGYFEVLRHYRGIVAIRTELQQRLLRERPDVFIGVDAPDFNLALERALRERRIKTVHFVCPSVWAWRAGRMAAIRASADHVLCVFPFEPDLLQRHDIAATYVGHPLASVIPLVPDRRAARVALGLEASEQVIALLPGSRHSEIEYLARRFFESLALLRKERPALRCVVPAVGALKQRLEQIANQSGMAAHVQILAGQSHAVLAACDVVLVASGTATLEAALFKRPMVIAYNMHWLSWRVMRRQRLQPWVGLPNILCREFVVPEYLQEQATPKALAAALLNWLDDPHAVAAVERRFTDLHHELTRDTSRLAADAIEQLLAA
ncbi:MAG: lipid-A-disaccharide synthase [Burkholderiaceae bacterium]